MKIANRLFLLFALAAAPGVADTMYQVSVNTSSLSAGAMGFIDLAFNGGFPATATIDNFTGATVNGATLFTQGTISGTLPGVVTIGDDNADYNEGVRFGSSIDFLLTLSGTPSGTIGDVFTVSFFGTDDATPLLTADENDGFLLQFALGTNGNVTATAFNSPTGGPSFASVTPVPEPGSASFLLAGLFCAGWYARRRPAPASR